jgi:hypothetical protein
LIDGVEIVGHIYRMKADRELWRWTIRLWHPPPGPSGGLPNTLDEAMAAFRAKPDEHASGLLRPLAGHPGGKGRVAGHGDSQAADHHKPAGRWTGSNTYSPLSKAA